MNVVRAIAAGALYHPAIRVSVLLLAVGCSRSSDDNSPASSLAPSASVAPAAAGSIAPKTEGCPHTGLWALCNVEQRLKQAGFVAKRVKGESPKRAGFTVTPTVYTLGRARLEVFIYKDQRALAADMARLDTLTVSPRGVQAAWEGTPVLIRTENLAAVYLGTNPQQAERLSLALTAGAPQPGSPR